MCVYVFVYVCLCIVSMFTTLQHESRKIMVLQTEPDCNWYSCFSS